MADIVLSSKEFEELAAPLVGLKVSLAWKGYGSAVFLELGALAPLESRRQQHNRGQACISVEWDWRVESEVAVLYGSSNSRPEIDAGIRSLQGANIEAVTVIGQVPELVIQFSNGHFLKSMVMVSGDPEWSIKLPDGRWVYARRGKLVIGDGTSPVSKGEVVAFALAKATAARWGVPRAEPMSGKCSACASFIPIDGEGHLLDYGCCAANGGPLDGRVVERSSGCPSFTSNAET